MRKGKEMTAALLFVAVYCFILYFLQIGCPIKFLTGISCAGCGMTRAWIAAFNFDLGRAFCYHPLFLLPPIFLCLYLCRSKINARFYKIFIFTIILLFAIIYVVRLLWEKSDVVVWRPQEGYVYRVLQIILRRK